MTSSLMKPYSVALVVFALVTLVPLHHDSSAATMFRSVAATPERRWPAAQAQDVSTRASHREQELEEIEVAVLLDFKQRVERYMRLHDRLRLDDAGLTQRVMGADRDQQEALASRIREARHLAKQGDIFGPDISSALRKVMNPELRGSLAAGTRFSIREDAPPRFALHVNGAYPRDASLPTMPVNVLNILPALPAGLEYRIVDTHLILRDIYADLVVDYLFDVMCARCDP